MKLSPIIAIAGPIATLCAVKPDYHRRWLTFIEYQVAGFFQHCEWERQSRLQHHLVFVNQKSAHRALNLVRHAYLHMAFDLPRTTADSCGAVPWIPLPGVPRAKAAYLSLGPALSSGPTELSRSIQSGLFCCRRSIVYSWEVECRHVFLQGSSPSVRRPFARSHSFCSTSWRHAATTGKENY